MSKNNKKLLFERMHKVAGMPLNENHSLNETIGLNQIQDFNSESLNDGSGRYVIRVDLESIRRDLNKYNFSNPGQTSDPDSYAYLYFNGDENDGYRLVLQMNGSFRHARLNKNEFEQLKNRIGNSEDIEMANQIIGQGGDSQLDEEIYRSKHGHMTIGSPIISDAEFLLSGNPNSVEVNSEEELNQLINQQNYFSLSQSRAYNTEEDFKSNAENTGSTIWFETGRELVALWNSNENKGWVLKK